MVLNLRFLFIHQSSAPEFRHNTAIILIRSSPRRCARSARRRPFWTSGQWVDDQRTIEQNDYCLPAAHNYTSERTRSIPAESLRSTHLSNITYQSKQRWTIMSPIIKIWTRAISWRPSARFVLIIRWFGDCTCFRSGERNPVYKTQRYRGGRRRRWSIQSGGGGGV